MLAEDDVVEDASCTEDIADGMRLGRHVLDIDDLRGDIARRAAPDKQVIGVVSDCGQSKVDNYWLLRVFAEDDVVRFEVTMDDVASGHLGEAPQHSLHDELTFTESVLGEVVEAAADGCSFDILEGKVD